MPGCLIAAIRHNRPTVIVYGGTIQPGVRHVDCPAMGYSKGDHVNISDAFESFGGYMVKYQATLKFCLLFFFLSRDALGAYTVGKINDEERFDVVRHACPGAGACGGEHT